MWNGAKLNSDDRGFLGHTLAGTNIKGDILPAPIIHKKLKSSICFRLGIGAYSILTAIALYLLALHPSGGVLASNSHLVDLFFIVFSQCVQYIQFFIAHFISIKGD